MPIPRIDTGETAKPLKDLEEQEFERRSAELHQMTDNQLLKEILTKSDRKCNSLIEKQNTLIADLTMTVSSLESENERNANKLKESVSSAVSEIKSLQAETRSLNNRVATETSYAIKRTTTTLESELKTTIAVQSQEVFAEVKKELDESKKLLETTREELRVQHGFRKFMFWATPILLFVQTALTAFLLLK